MERLGIVDDIRAERERVLANVSPAHRDRLLGRRPVYVEATAKTPAISPPDISLSDAVRRAEQRAQNTRMPDPPVDGPSIYSIFVAVTDVTGISVGELVSPSHAYRVARPRFLAAWLIKTLRADMGFPAIGRALNRDHTTIMSAVKRFEGLATEQPYVEWLAHPAIVALLEKGGRS